MPSDPGRHDSGLDPADRERLAAIRSAGSLADLVGVTGADSEHDAYFEAKRDWYDLRGKELPPDPPTDGIPGDCVVVDGHEFCVHGITHADTSEERAFLREHVSRLLEAGATVYCEQGIRPMYFSDLPAVCEMDDLRWAMERCRELEVDSVVSEFEGTFDGLVEDLDSLTGRFREATFSLIRSGGDVYGDEFEAALGDVASDFLTSHEDMATGDDFESFTRTRRASEEPGELDALQRYYKRTFLPQPVESEWLRRHDRELELVTHGRNERMVEYVLYHNEDAEEVHLIVGAAHQPGVTYYLERFRDGEKRLEGFELVG